MKYFVFSIDDGTVFDKMTIALFNKYHVRATFNLNSGLDDFVWYLNDLPIQRLTLKDNVDLYANHEVASHTLTHPYLELCTDEEVIRQVKEDVDNLEKTFHREIVSFATPFHTSGEREVDLIRHNTKITNIRLSQFDKSFRLPKDPYHFRITSLNIDDALSLVDEFIKDKDAELFVYAGHSYDFYVANSFDKLEALLKKITQVEDITILPMGELTKKIF